MKGRWIKCNPHMWVFVAPDGTTHARAYKDYSHHISHPNGQWLCYTSHTEGNDRFNTAAAAKRHAKERLARLLKETEVLR